MELNLDQSWTKELGTELKKPYFKTLLEKIELDYNLGKVYPKKDEVFKALNLCSLSDVKVVIIGQDPYHGENQANGLAFSVNNNIKIPPSLQNIFKEIEDSLKINVNKNNGNLTRYASQGVLLLNSILTVKEKLPGSHRKLGWEKFTDKIIQILNKEKNGLIFMLWGEYAKNKGSILDKERHLVLETTHPSPFSAYKGFLGCKHFLKANNYLIKQNMKPINWS